MSHALIYDMTDFFPPITERNEEEEVCGIENQAEIDALQSLNTRQGAFPTQSTSGASVTHLREMFPARPVSEIENILSTSDTFETAFEGLLEDEPMEVASLTDDYNYSERNKTGTFDMVDHFEETLTGMSKFQEIDRENVWQEAFSFYKKEQDFKRPLRIEFAGVEQGIDAGGPRKEYFQIFANKIASVEVGLFERNGESNAMFPVMNSSCLRLGHFKLIGKAIAHSIANRGIGFPFLAEPLFCYLVCGVAEECLPSCNIAMVPGFEARDMMRQIAEAESKSQFQLVVSKPEIMDYCEKCGWTSLLDFDKREDILATMLLHELIWKRQTAIDQLIVGLGILNVIDLIKRYPELFKDKLVHSPNIVSKERLLEEMYIVRPTTEDEERTATFFDNYLGTDGQLEIADEKYTRPEATLMFSTGQRYLGSAPLPENVTVNFGELEAGDFPAASTCSANLTLPTVHKSFDVFREKMDKAFEIELVGFAEA